MAADMIGRSFGHYRIVEHLGSGGMGVVYRATDENLRRDVAIKVLPSGTITDPAARRQLLKEAQAISRLNHPGIATVYDFDTYDGLDALVMEYVPGETLDAKLAQGPLPPRDTLKLSLQLAEALAAAHEAGVVHRDLKPANLRLTPDGHLKILDFGIAQFTRPADMSAATVTATATSAIAGTLPYMAPEQLRGEGADARTDIHALGAVIYEMATGQRAFPQAEPALLFNAILNTAPDSPRTVNPSTSEGLEVIVAKALDKDPEHRYQSAREIAVDIRRLLSPTGAAAASVAPRRRTRRRFLWMTGAGVAAGVLAIVGWFVSARPVLSFAPRDWVLVTDFDNQTKEPLFDRSLLTAFTIALQQSRHANVFPQARIETVLRRMTKTGVEAIDERLGREICVREHIRGLIAPSISRIGPQYSISARLVDPETGDAVRSYMESAPKPEDILPALERVAAAIRRDLGESLAAISQSNRALPKVTTPSLEALKQYADAKRLWGKGKYDDAVTLYNAALQHDPDFAMAHAALGAAFYSHIYSDPVRGKAHFEKAIALTGRTTDRERLDMQAAYESSLGHQRLAEARYSLYVQQYPDDFRMHYNFGVFLMNAKRYPEAVLQYAQVLRVDPTHAFSYINTATCLSSLQRYDEALTNYDKAFALEPDWITSGNLNHEYGFTLIKAGRVDAARAVFARAIQKPQLKAMGLRSTALLEMTLGRYSEARRVLGEAIVTSEAEHQTMNAARHHVFMAVVGEGLGDRALMVQHLRKADAQLHSLSPPSWLVARLATWYLRARAISPAAALLKELEAGADPNSTQQNADLLRLQGELALLSGRTADALDKMLLADRALRSALTLEALARTRAQRGDIDQAIADYESLLKMPGECLGWEGQHLWFDAYYRIAVLEHQRGRDDDAKRNTRALLDAWASGDQTLPLIVDARRLDDQLQKE